MGDSLGLLKVTVVQGKRLVIRDFKSSDPYVVVKLGNQVNLVSFFYNCFYKNFMDMLLIPHACVHRHLSCSARTHTAIWHFTLS